MPQPASLAAVLAGRPLLWHAVAFAVGVAAGLRTVGDPPPWLAAAGGLSLLCLLLRCHGRAALLGGLGVALCLGVARGGWALVQWSREPLRPWLGVTVTLEGTVGADPEARRSGGERCDLHVDRVAAAGGGWQTAAGWVRVTSDTALGVEAGDRVRGRAELQAGRAAGNPGEFSYRRFLRQQGLVALAHLTEPPERLGRGRPPWTDRASRRLRQWLCGNVRATMPGPAARQFADLLNAMVFGIVAAPVDPALETACRRSGVVHVLVASGTQVSLLLAVVVLLTRLIPVPDSVTFAIAALAMGGYALVTGFEPSILRATLMGVLVFAALVTGRDYDLPTALGLAAAGLLAVQPFTLDDLGFQLTFAATAGIVALGLPLAAWLRPRLGGAVATSTALTLAAQAAVAPLLIWHFRRLSLIGLVANLPVIPLSGVLVVTGLVASLLGGVAPLLARGVNWVSHVLLSWFVALIGACARVPWAELQPVIVPPAWLLGYAAALGGLAMTFAAPGWWTGWSRPRQAVTALGLVGLAAAAAVWHEATATCDLVVFDVDNGDSLLVRSPSGRCLLVDGGPRLERDGEVRDAGAERVVPALMLLGVRRLDAVVATHRHADHIGGLPAVLGAYPVGRVLAPPGLGAAPAVDRLREAAGRRGRALETLRRGDCLDLGDGVRVWAVWPPARPVSGTNSDVNNNAAVLKVVYGGVSFLLASDLEAAGEELLLRHGGDLRATVLKVPHQGSRTSTSLGLLDAVQPRSAVVTTGPNNYGQPSEAVLSRLTARGVSVRRTDVDGMVTYRTDGRTVETVSFGRR